MDGAESRIAVEVAYALPERQYCVAVSLPATATVAEAIAASGLLARCPELNPEALSVGIFSERTTLDAGLADGDRVEIYRPLQVDPKAQRRARARAQKSENAQSPR